MRILWSSVSPFVGTGYGSQTAIAARRLRSLGHDVAILCHYGLSGAKSEWGDIPLYPSLDPGDYGAASAPTAYADFNADLLITLVDVWVLRQMDPTLKWCPWTPVDHDPPPPLVIDTLKRCAGIIKPIAISKFGMKKLNDAGVDCYYIPHTVNTKLFKPDMANREKNRIHHRWQDKFVIGTVGTNQVERKNWNAAMLGVKIFEHEHPSEIIWYMHTNLTDPKGINLSAMIDSLQIKPIVRVPSLQRMQLGIAQEEMASMYQSLDVFLLPSKGEGFGIPLIEAQSSGIPIITTNCTAQAELMGGGWFIEKLRPQWTAQASFQFDCDPEEIAEKLELAYQAKKNGSIVEMQHKAREKALEYDEDAIYSTYWPSVLADIEEQRKKPKNMEGIQNWRLQFIPQSVVPRKVLDLGSGLTMPYKKYLEVLGEYVAVDNRSDGSNGIIKADAHNLPFASKEFGFLWCSEMLEHCDHPEQVVQEAKRVSQHGVILFPTPKNPFFRVDPGHKVIDPRKVRYAEMHTGDGCITF